MERFEIHPVVCRALPEAAVFLYHQIDPKVRESTAGIERRLKWLLLENPAAGDGAPLGVCLRDESGAIRGLNLCFPAHFLVGDQRLRGLGSGSFFVDTEARSMGFYLFKKYLGFKDYSFHFASTCNAGSSELWSTAGGCAVPHSQMEYAIPLRLDVTIPVFVSSFISGSGGAARIARLGGRAANPILRFLTRPAAGFTVEPCQDWEKLSELSARHRCERFISMERSAAFLEWRYGPTSPLYPCGVYLVRDPKGNEGWFALGDLTRGREASMRVSVLLDAIWPSDKMDFNSFNREMFQVAASGADIIFLRWRPGLDLREYRPLVIPRKLVAPQAFVKTPRGAPPLALDLFEYDDSDDIAWRFR